MIYGAIADDYTGASDLAGMLAGRGVRTMQTLGLPDENTLAAAADGFDAVVIALKSRSIEPAAAIGASLEALEGLRKLDAEQVQFKYCSTFDSTERGNIGPVTDALLTATDETFTVAVPALPINGRTQYGGCLFVNGQLLSQSSMRDHPLNPMREPNLVRHLQQQTSRKVGLTDWTVVRSGPKAIGERFRELADEGVSISLVDVLDEDDLTSVAEACSRMRLVTGGSGLGMRLPEIWRRQDRLGEKREETSPARRDGAAALILSGSCSAATLAQVADAERRGIRSAQVDAPALLRGDEEIDRLEVQARRSIANSGAALVSSSADAEERERIRETAGVDAEEIRLAIERCFGELARRIVGEGDVQELIVAGGETSGAAVEALGVKAMEVLGPIDPGVPAMRTVGEPSLRLALKSGNFGAPDFFTKALGVLRST